MWCQWMLPGVVSVEGIWCGVSGCYLVWRQWRLSGVASVEVSGVVSVEVICLVSVEVVWCGVSGCYLV